MPLSPDFPVERIRGMLDDCDTRILVTELKFKAQVEKIKNLRSQRRSNAITHNLDAFDAGSHKAG